MREAPDPRVLLEVALVRLCRPELDTSPQAMLDRIERLERALASRPPGPTPTATGGPPLAATAPAGPAHAGTPAADPASSGPAAGARLALGGVRAAARVPAAAAAPPPPSPPPSPPSPPAPDAPAAPAGDVPMPTRDELTMAWGDKVVGALPARAKSRFRVGRFVAADAAGATFALPNGIHRDRCEEVRGEVEQALAAYFGRPVPLRLITEEQAPSPATAPGPPPDDESIDVNDLQDAPASELRSPVDHVLSAFEGATVVEE
jgi:DNA polymerase-3 subunit gamma/tau